MKNGHIVISIITPSYNQGAFLAETIESVISQAGEFFIDYIIMDGSSTDNSADIIKRYDLLLKTGQWPIKCGGITCRWISERDKGQTDALMKGFGMATGSIFAWLNSDDTYLPGALQTAADFFRDHPETGLMFGDAHYIDPAGAVISRYRTEVFDLTRLASANIICQPAAFFQREAFEAVGGLDATLDFVMDYDLWIRIGRRFPGCYHAILLATYRLHETSKTICNASLGKNSEEALAVTMRHFHWAPLTRVYTACHILCATRLPNRFVSSRLFMTAATVVCALFRYLYLNRGVNRNDLQLLNRDNFRKLTKSRLEIMTGGKP
ncbi:MAG: glycosyltransferase family 2 protein [Desulfuromonadaceae bacterium]|nr:glycosyltransferase family 2 protein [Desulfuromonadaceae bacterium]MDD5106923.1 glycosyltransferase family 2 protein [Desulfuromonadaceae bacterium]